MIAIICMMFSGRRSPNPACVDRHRPQQQIRFLKIFFINNFKRQIPSPRFCGKIFNILNTSDLLAIHKTGGKEFI